MKLVNITELKNGNLILYDNELLIVRGLNMSKPGAHGPSKGVVEAFTLIDDKKKILKIPGGTKIILPYVEKRKAQVLSVKKHECKATVMDLENYETTSILVARDIIDTIKENDQVEYWIIEEKQIIKRIVSS